MELSRVFRHCLAPLFAAAQLQINAHAGSDWTPPLGLSIAPLHVLLGPPHASLLSHVIRCSPVSPVHVNKKKRKEKRTSSPPRGNAAPRRLRLLFRSRGARRCRATLCLLPSPWCELDRSGHIWQVHAWIGSLHRLFLFPGRVVCGCHDRPRRRLRGASGREEIGAATALGGAGRPGGTSAGYRLPSSSFPPLTMGFSKVCLTAVPQYLAT